MTEKSSGQHKKGKTRPLTVILVVIFMLTWHFAQEIQDFFNNVVFEVEKEK